MDLTIPAIRNTHAKRSHSLRRPTQAFHHEPRRSMFLQPTPRRSVFLEPRRSIRTPSGSTTKGSFRGSFRSSFPYSTRNSFRGTTQSVWRKLSTGTLALSMDDNEGASTFVGVPTGANPRLWFSLIYSTFTLAAFHFTCGFISIGVGVITTIAAEHTVYAHTVSPIWSGLSFVVAGFCGISAARKRTVYMIHLFIGVSVCAMILLLISIQLLRLGLVYHTSDGNTYQKDQKDIWIILALSDAGVEGFICLIAVFTSWKMARLANVPPEPVKDDGPFRIQITKGGSHYMTMNKYTNKRKISSL